MKYLFSTSAILLTVLAISLFVFVVYDTPTIFEMIIAIITSILFIGAAFFSYTEYKTI
jgi:hypothetical protein